MYNVFMKYWYFLVLVIILLSGCVQNSGQISQQQDYPQPPCIKEECATYCSENPEECHSFCLQNPSHEICQHGGGERPQPPRSPQQIENISISSLPFDPENYRYDVQGIWPFCVHGGDHPEGHGGIDFELAPNTPIIAVADGRVGYIERPENSPHGWGGGVHIVSEAQVVGYVCLVNISVKEGDEVKKGQLLGYPCADDKGTHFIHFEVGDFIREKRVCPLEYMTEEVRKEIEQMFSKAHYPEQANEPNLCNCEALPLPKAGV